MEEQDRFQRHTVATGESLSQATIRLVKAGHGGKGRPVVLDVRGKSVYAVESMSVPRNGVIELEFLRWGKGVRQGADIKIDKGWIALSDGTKVQHLRTWCDPELGPRVRHPYFARDENLRTWNVYERQLPGHPPRVDQLDGNAGLWVERVSDTERIIHCSPGDVAEPDFESLVYRVRVVASVDAE